MTYKIKVTQPHTKFSPNPRVVYIKASHYEPKYTDYESHAYEFQSKNSAQDYILNNYIFGNPELIVVATELDKFIDYLANNLDLAHEQTKVALFDITRIYNKYKGEQK